MIANSLSGARVRRALLASVALVAVSAIPAVAQRSGGSSAPSRAAQPALIGTWTGTATIPLADSALVVPVSYTFTRNADGIAGTATAPGQQAGPISAVVSDSTKVTFRVVTPQGTFDHQGKFGADGALEGTISMNNLPAATFKIKKQG